MPAVITHHIFGKEVYGELHGLIGDSRQEHDAFMLGCQGPDVFFFGVLNPLIAPSWGIGSRMHSANPNALLSAVRDAAGSLVDEASPIGRAYAMGLYCHYALDSMLHPFVYSQQYAICDAGIDGLDRSDGHEVHAEIESELDLLVLTAKEGCTISSFNPARKALPGDADTLAVASFVNKRAIKEAFGKSIPADSFSESLLAYRAVLSAIYSPYGLKRELLGRLERSFRRHSFVHAMSHRNELVHESIFDNSGHAEWVDPFTGDIRTESFWELYGMALGKARAFLPALMSAKDVDFERATSGLDFNGKPTTAYILKVE